MTSATMPHNVTIDGDAHTATRGKQALQAGISACGGLLNNTEQLSANLQKANVKGNPITLLAAKQETYRLLADTIKPIIERIQAAIAEVEDQVGNDEALAETLKNTGSWFDPTNQ
jgi:hypothetical protein